MSIKKRLENLAQSWRHKAASCEEKFGELAPAQAQVAKASFEQCAEELEDLAKEVSDEAK